MKARPLAAALGAAVLLVVALPVARRTVLASHLPPHGVAREPTAPGRFVKRTFGDGGVVYQYQVFFPRDYDPAIPWPILVALHGSGEKGSDGEKQVRVGVANVIREWPADFPAVVVFPQVPSGGLGGDHAPAIARLVDSVVHEVHGDPRRIYLTGLSFGGVLAYRMAREQPGHFAALITVSAPLVIQPGGRETRLSPSAAGEAEASALRGTAVWIFQGANDPNVPVAATRQVVQSLTRAGVAARYTEYADGGHEIWDRAYREGALWHWLFEQRR